MDALVLPFLLALLTEVGSPTQVLALALGERFRAIGAVIAGLACGFLLDTAVAAAAGAALGPEMPARARHLLLGVALLLVAIGRVRPAKQVDHARNWQRLGALGASLVTAAILAFGGEVQLAVAALAAGGRSPWLVAPAAAAGMLVACLPPLAGGRRAMDARMWPTLRWAVAIGFALAGTLLVLSALELV